MLEMYRWNSPQLQKKARLCNILTLVSMALVIVFLKWLESMPFVFVSLGLGTLFFVLSGMIQGKDRKLQKPKS